MQQDWDQNELLSLQNSSQVVLLDDKGVIDEYQAAYFRRSKRFTKSRCDFATVPSFRMLRFLFLDFFVRM